MPGLIELLVVLAILIVVFGAGRLPRLGEALGRAVRGYRDAARSRDDIEVQPGETGRPELPPSRRP